MYRIMYISYNDRYDLLLNDVTFTVGTFYRYESVHIFGQGFAWITCSQTYPLCMVLRHLI